MKNIFIRERWLQKVGITLIVLANAGILSSAPASVEPLKIRVVDGRNGKPITNETVQVWINRKEGDALQLPTDKEGIARLDVSRDSRILVASNRYFDCRPFHKEEPRPVYSVSEILKSGVATRNTCGKLNLEAGRGELLFFVRPFHWWEGVRR
jgi:hypothetical protein